MAWCRAQEWDGFKAQWLPSRGWTAALVKYIVRIILRDKKTDMYYAHPNKWVSIPDEAHDFHSGGQAIDVARQFELHEAEMIYHFGDKALDFCIPIPH